MECHWLALSRALTLIKPDCYADSDSVALPHLMWQAPAFGNRNSEGRHGHMTDQIVMQA